MIICMISFHTEESLQPSSTPAHTPTENQLDWPLCNLCCWECKQKLFMEICATWKENQSQSKHCNLRQLLIFISLKWNISFHKIRNHEHIDWSKSGSPKPVWFPVLHSLYPTPRVLSCTVFTHSLCFPTPGCSLETHSSFVWCGFYAALWWCGWVEAGWLWMSFWWRMTPVEVSSKVHHEKSQCRADKCTHQMLSETVLQFDSLILFYVAGWCCWWWSDSDC